MSSGEERRTYNRGVSDLTIDEDIRIDSNLAIDKNTTYYAEPPKPPGKRHTFKPKAAGYLLILTFVLNILLPINFIYFIYDAETSTGKTGLNGEILSDKDSPVANVTVEILDLNISTKTNETGKYSFKDLPVGEHIIQYSKTGFQTIEIHKVLFSKQILNNIGEKDNFINIPGWIQNVYIDYYSGPAVEYIEIENKFNDTLYGEVRNQTGSIAQNVRIDVLNSNISTISNNDGQYMLNNITPGIVDLQLSHPQNVNITTYRILFASNSSTIMNLTYNDQFNRSFDEVIDKFGSIQCKIRNSDDKPIENALVMLIIDSANYPNNSTRTNIDGEFAFEYVPIGIYSIRILAPEYYITYQTNITVQNSTVNVLPDAELQSLDERLTAIEDIKSNETYTCIIILIIFAVITLIGGISALQRKRYGLAFMGAIIGMVPMLLISTSYICGASLVSLIALLMLVFSREEFSFKPVQ